MFNLVICYENEEDVEQNQREAIRFNKLVKIMNQTNGIFNLVCLL
jgi:TPR repeat protein